MKSQEESQSLTVEEQNKQEKTKPKPMKHIYLEQENIYGRFIPYLLLRDQLDTQIDSSGETALHHMCSYNSPYIPLFLSLLKQNDPILNTKSQKGHTPLDVAGCYCSKEIVQMLKEKGAVDHGNVDRWAIQGANIGNWSGKIDPQKKYLIQWAAYNDLPDVINQYGKAGVNLSEPDSNGYTAIDLAILNKSYKSAKALAQFGQRPKDQLLKSSDSKSLKTYFAYLDQHPARVIFKKVVKALTLPYFLLLCIILSPNFYTQIFAGVTVFFFLYLLVIKTPFQKYMNDQRKTSFTSELLWQKQINRRNQIPYLLMHFLFILTGIISILTPITNSYWTCLILIIIIFSTGSYLAHFIVQIYGICHNLTYSQLFQSHKWPHLWNKIMIVSVRNMLVHIYSNPNDKGFMQNIKAYWHLGKI